MPAALPTAFFPSRQSQRLEKERVVILDVEEATGAPRLTAANIFGPELRNGLLCGGDPVNHSDPSGLSRFGDWIRKLRDTAATTERIVITGSAVPDAVAGLTSQGGAAGGWFSGNSPRGMLGLLNLPSAGSTGDGGFSIRTGVTPGAGNFGATPLPSSPPAPAGNPGNNGPLNAVANWMRNNANFTIAGAQTFGVIPIPAGSAPILVPVGGQAFATFDKTGITFGVGTGVVAASGWQVVTGAPYGNTGGTQLVSQVFGSLGPVGGYYSGIFSQGGTSTEYGGGFGLGGGASITIDMTFHVNWPGGR